jgi:tetratricopeptide (TPR) repeat protein
MLIGLLCALPGAAQTRHVVIRVLDGNNHAVKGVRLRATKTGSVSSPSDQNGLTWIAVSSDTQPGAAISIQVVNGLDQAWLLMNPPDDVIIVRAFDAAEQNIVPITVVSRRDPQLLINGQLLYSSAQRMLENLRPSHVARYLSPAQTRAVLDAEAKRLGFQPGDLASALQAWGATTRDPLQKATVALFEQRFHDATALLTPIFNSAADRTFSLAKELGFSLYSEGAYADAARKYEIAVSLRPDDYKAVNDLGMMRVNLGQYTQAEELLNRSLALMKDRLAPGDPEVAATMQNKGWLFLSLHKFDDAQRAYEQAVVILKGRFGVDSPQVLLVDNDFGAISEERGDYKRAEQYYVRALTSLQAKRHLSSDYLTVLTNLAGAERGGGEFDLADEHFRAALQLAEQLVRNGIILPDHPIIGHLHNEYYGLLSKTGRYEEAEREILAAKEIVAKSLGEGHPEFADTLNNLAGVYARTDRPNLVLPLLKQAVSITEQAFGRDHPVTAMRLNNVAVYYMRRHAFAETEPLLERARTILEGEPLYNAINLAVVYNNLGELYTQTGKRELAETYLLKAIKLREPGTDVLEYTTSLINLGDLYRSEQRFAEAEPLLQKALDGRQNTPALGTEALVTALAQLGGLYFVQGKYEQAEIPWRRALDLTDRRSTSHNLQSALAQSLNNLGALYVRMKKLDEAEPLLKRAYDLWPHLGLGESDGMMRTCEHYSALLNELGRTDEGKVIAEQGEAIRQKLAQPKE